jgi:hypothetical protein
MSYDAEDVLCDKLKNNIFSIQMDESTDFTNKSYAAAFVRFVNYCEIQGRLFLLQRARNKRSDMGEPCRHL